MQQLKQSELKPLRIRLHKEQNNVCPILKQEFDLSEMVVDHQHKQKQSDTNGVNGGGMVRGCIHNQANVIEGKISNTYKRYGLHKFIELPELLRNLADYLEQENLPYIHPTERTKPKKLKKRCYNTLKKSYKGRAKFPPYPKSGLLTKPLRTLFERYEIEPQFYA